MSSSRNLCCEVEDLVGRAIFVVVQYITKGMKIFFKVHDVFGETILLEILEFRIERFWRDVFYGVLGFYKNVFFTLEDRNLLDVENPKHLSVLHRIFLPRLNRHLEQFRIGWNRHPLSSESGFSPDQLFLMNLPPPSYRMIMHEVTTLKSNHILIVVILEK
jgi:hypothetical protein